MARARWQAARQQLSKMALIKDKDKLKQYLGAERNASVSRELSKMFEENKRGTLEQLIPYFSEKTVKGEIAVVVEGKNKKEKNDSAD